MPPTSTGRITTPQSTQLDLFNRPGMVDHMRSRSETVLSRGGGGGADCHPRSRGSTASIHSTTTQQTQEQHIVDGLPPFLPAAQQTGTGHHVFTSNPEEMIMRFGQQLSHQTADASSSLDPSLQDPRHHSIPRPDDFGHALPHHHSLASGLTAHGLPAMSVPHYQAIYGNGMESHVADHMMDDNESSEVGSRKRKGSSATIASDNELRKLLRQYDGYSLKQMAVEVLKNEGAGGKAEKVKQVFAMIWLRENCKKSTGSVRRDRVYCCYAERCGTERVSVLNPASFGKLVRVIFPNVQTRRLGVRGESKYHYVDLTVIEEKQVQPESLVSQRPASRGASVGLPAQRAGSADHQRSISQPPTYNAGLSPTIPSAPDSVTRKDCACQYNSRLCVDSTVSFENVASYSGKMVHQMLEFPTTDGPSVDTESLRLPDIHPYLPENTDLKIAAALTALYRSHCVSVIDSFRYCKERNLMRYFSAFHGTLTVPVQKLLSHPRIAPWVKECDWLMYQKMIAFVSPLTTQVVPKLVLDAFNSISQRLTAHIAETFKTQPVHVALARLIPAYIFCNLLRHMLDVNQAANAAAAWLCHPDNRNQMWFDFKTLVDPKEMMIRANVPSCAEPSTEQFLKHGVRALLTPLVDPSPSVAQHFFHQPDPQGETMADRYPVESSAIGEEYNFPDKWISFILNLPAVFPQHHSQCIIEKVNALWDCILRRLTLGGAQSFSAWWMTKVFFHEMMLWQAEKGGFMNNTPSGLEESSKEAAAAAAAAAMSEQIRPEHDSFEREASKNSIPDRTADEPLTATAATTTATRTNSSMHPNGTNAKPSTTNSNSNSNSPPGESIPRKRDFDQAQLEEAVAAGVPPPRSPPPPPQPQQQQPQQQPPSQESRDSNNIPENMANLHASASNNDDSAIDLDDDSMLISVGKYGDMMASDPADAEGDVVVI